MVTLHGANPAAGAFLSLLVGGRSCSECWGSSNTNAVKDWDALESMHKSSPDVGWNEELAPVTHLLVDFEGLTSHSTILFGGAWERGVEERQTCILAQGSCVSRKDQETIWACSCAFGCLVVPFPP